MASGDPDKAVERLGRVHSPSLVERCEEKEEEEEVGGVSVDRGAGCEVDAVAESGAQVAV